MKQIPRRPNNDMLDVTAVAAKVELRIPVFLSVQLWRQLTKRSTADSDDPMLYSLLGQLKQAVCERSEGHSYGACLERGIDFDVEVGSESATAFASIDFSNGGVNLRLCTSDECFQELQQQMARAFDADDWQDPIGQAENISKNIDQRHIVASANLIHVDMRVDYAKQMIVHGTAPGGACIRFVDRSTTEARRRAIAGAKHKFLIWGVAYDLVKAVKEDSITLTQATVVELERQRVREQNLGVDTGNINSVRISLSELRALLPCGDADEHYEFWTMTETVDWLAFGDASLCRIGAVLMLPSDIPFRATIFAHPDLLGGYRPKPGDRIQGAALLSGYSVK